MNFIKNYFYILLLVTFFDVCSMVICTAGNSAYFPHLLNLIGSIHKIDFDNLQEIMVFDLGLTNQEIQNINSIQKTHVYKVKKTDPSILDFMYAPQGYRSLGWFAWKPVVIKQALDRHERVLWLDAGNTVLKSLMPIFECIDEFGYFICTIGNDTIDGRWKHPVGWGATRFVREKYDLDSRENRWILDQEFIEGGICGFKKNHEIYKDFLMPLYQSTFDIRNFEDDGTPPGLGRHDQVLMSILVYQKHLKFFRQDYTQRYPMVILGKDIFITWNPAHVDDRTTLYRSRNDIGRIDNFEKYIRRF